MMCGMINSHDAEICVVNHKCSCFLCQHKSKHNANRVVCCPGTNRMSGNCILEYLQITYTSTIL